ncbi:unnamed protein product, partial [Prorocentrum cordatum]
RPPPSKPAWSQPGRKERAPRGALRRAHGEAPSIRPAVYPSPRRHDLFVTLGHSVPSERSAPRATGRRLGTLASEEDRGPLVRSTLGPTAGGGGVGLGRREEGGGRGEDGRVKAGRDKIHFSEFSGSEHANTLVPSCTYSHRAFRATYRHDIQVSRFASLMLKKEGDDFKGIA